MGITGYLIGKRKKIWDKKEGPLPFSPKANEKQVALYKARGNNMYRCTTEQETLENLTKRNLIRRTKGTNEWKEKGVIGKRDGVEQNRYQSNC